MFTYNDMKSFGRSTILCLSLLIIAAILVVNYVAFIFHSEDIISSENRVCLESPSNNVNQTQNWQIQSTNDGTFHFFNVYLDDRKFDPSEKNMFVRILGVSNIPNPDNPLCQIFYDNDTITVKSQISWIFDQRETNATVYQPFLLTCGTLDNRIPKSVSVVEDICDTPTNNLKIIYEKSIIKKDFAVCVKGIDFSDEESFRLIEWIELINILGATKIHFYEFELNPGVEKILNYYQNQSQERIEIEVTPLSLSHAHKYQNALFYTDCLYRHLYSHRYIINLDTNEIIFPTTGTWQDLMMHLRTRNANSFIARNVQIFDQLEINILQIPPCMYMVKHVTRSEEILISEAYTKGFYNTEKVVAVGTEGCLKRHYLWQSWLWWLNDCDFIDIGWDLVRVNRYNGCNGGVVNCENRVVDMGVWRFREELLERVGEVVTGMKMLG